MTAVAAGQKIKASIINMALNRIPVVPTTTSADGTITVGTTDTMDLILGTYTFTATAGRRYRAMLTGMVIGATVVSDRYTCNIRNGGASTPTTASTSVALVTHVIVVAGTGGREGVVLSGTFVPGAGTQTLAVFVARSIGTGVATPAGTRELYVEDIGDV